MAQVKLVIKDFLGFKAGEVKSFSDEICKKFADNLSEPEDKTSSDLSEDKDEIVKPKATKIAKKEKL